MLWLSEKRLLSKILSDRGGLKLTDTDQAKMWLNVNSHSLKQQNKNLQNQISSLNNEKLRLQAEIS